MIHSKSKMSAIETDEIVNSNIYSYGSQLRVVYNQLILSQPICSSRECLRFLHKIWDDDLVTIQEQVYVLFLNNNNQVISYRCLHTGTTSQTLFDVKLALACALNCLAKKIIIAHNHPSGNLKPSPGDIAVTEQLRSACDLMDIQLIDHMILSAVDYFSFKDNRLVF